jgi:hypothetical protein
MITPCRFDLTEKHDCKNIRHGGFYIGCYSGDKMQLVWVFLKPLVVDYFQVPQNTGF